MTRVRSTTLTPASGPVGPAARSSLDRTGTRPSPDETRNGIDPSPRTGQCAPAGALGVAADCSTQSGAFVKAIVPGTRRSLVWRTIQRRGLLQSNAVQLLWPNMDRSLQHDRFGVQHARTPITLVDGQVFVNFKSDLELRGDKAEDHRHRSIGHANYSGGPTILTIDRV